MSREGRPVGGHLNLDVLLTVPDPDHRPAAYFISLVSASCTTRQEASFTPTVRACHSPGSLNSTG
ncbi:hypothetical protein AB0I10_25950 [Streptomyces sp. NPDC050636]|uniref:hypothetical protein n=1 Tax=Streptomyces sp. NPDC050636 TaxID=3154510 RepID=UPI003431CD02